MEKLNYCCYYSDIVCYLILWGYNEQPSYLQRRINQFNFMFAFCLFPLCWLSYSWSMVNKSVVRQNKSRNIEINVNYHQIQLD